MRSSVALVIFRLAISVALAVSAALLVDYLRPLPAFCDLSGGCGAVRASALGRAGALMPSVGLIGFATLMITSLVRGGSSRWLLRTSAAGAIAAVALLLVQAFVVGAFCRLCVIVDLAAIVAFGALLVHRRASSSPEVSHSKTDRWLWGGTSALAIAVPIAIGVLQPSPPVPREIAELWKPGKINVVEMTDFQCPFCRRLHPVMVEAMRAHGDRVHFVRLNMPLRSHPQARGAARAFVCADRQGKGEEMADALFAARELSPEHCEKLAEGLGLSMPTFRACVSDSATDAKIDADAARVTASGFQGLPTVWIGNERLMGLQPSGKVFEAFARAASDVGNTRSHAPANLLWATLAAGIVGVGVVALRMGRGPTTPGE